MTKNKKTISIYVVAVLFGLGFYGTDYYEKIVVDSCFQEQIDTLKDMNDSFNKLDITKDRTVEQKAIVKQMAKVDILRIAPVEEQLTMCKEIEQNKKIMKNKELKEVK